MFYTSSDFLVYYTLASVISVKYGVTICSMSLMRNHTHQSLYANSLKNISSYIRDLSSLFVKSFNRRGGVRISFNHRFGSSSKYSAKDKRFCTLYILNNPVEKMECPRSVDYKWNFLDNGRMAPTTRISDFLRIALNTVTRIHRTKRPLTYDFFNAVFPKLSTSEKQLLIDHIIEEYRMIDYHKTAELFDGYDRMIEASKKITGVEYDIYEPKARENYGNYHILLKAAYKMKLFNEKGAVCRLSGKELESAIKELISCTPSNNLEIARFLHCPEEYVKYIRLRYY